MTSALRNFLFILILFVLTFEIIRFYDYVENYSQWQYSDWLINYQGGLVRRGFIGQLLYLFHKITKTDLDLIIFLFFIFLYLFISYFLIKSVKYIENIIENFLIFLSPGFFIYPVMNSGIIGRKDILIISIIVFFVFLEKKIINRYLFPSFLLSLAILCFSHSGFLFYSQYLFFLFILIKHNRNLTINKIEFIIFCSTIALIILLINSFGGTQSTIDNICLSVKEFASPDCGKGDQIYHLSDENTNIYDRLFEKINLGTEYLFNYFIIYGFSIFIVFFFISKKLFYSKFKIKVFNYNLRRPFFVFLFIFILTFPMFVIGRDWGRYIYISYNCIFFIYIYCIKEKIIKFNTTSLKWLKNKIFLLIFLFFYSFFITFPFYDAKSFKLTLQKPITKILEKID